MNEIWIAKTSVDGKTLYLVDYAGVTEYEVKSKVWSKAREEGFKGTVDDRLAELGWTVVKVQIVESAIAHSKKERK